VNLRFYVTYTVSSVTVIVSDVRLTDVQQVKHRRRLVLEVRRMFRRVNHDVSSVSVLLMQHDVTRWVSDEGATYEAMVVGFDVDVVLLVDEA